MDAVIFDMDGVLVDTEDIYYDFLRNHLLQKGIRVGPEFDRFRVDFRGSTTFDLWDRIKEIYNLEESVRDELVPEARKAYLQHVENLPTLEPVSGVKNLIHRFKAAGIKLGLSSSSSRARIPLMLSRTGLREHFPEFVSADDVQKGKPAPDCYLLAAEKIGVHPSRCIVIEDAIHGVAAAKAAGMKTVGFNGLKPNVDEHCVGDINVMHFDEVNVDALRRLFS